MNKKQIKEYCFIGIVLLIIIFISKITNIRTCLFYNVFKIPCVGCGLTRSITAIFKGNIVTSFKYNILGLPLFIVFLISIFWLIFDIITKKETFLKFVKNNKVILIILAIIATIITWWINLNNPILY